MHQFASDITPSASRSPGGGLSRKDPLKGKETAWHPRERRASVHHRGILCFHANRLVVSRNCALRGTSAALVEPQARRHYLGCTCAIRRKASSADHTRRYTSA